MDGKTRVKVNSITSLWFFKNEFRRNSALVDSSQDFLRRLNVLHLAIDFWGVRVWSKNLAADKIQFRTT